MQWLALDLKMPSAASLTVNRGSASKAKGIHVGLHAVLMFIRPIDRLLIPDRGFRRR
jgi:hypothetical protein